MNWIARKTSTNNNFTKWDLFDSNNVHIGVLSRNVYSQNYSVSAISAQTGLHLTAQVFYGLTEDVRAEALAWVRQTVENEPPLTEEYLNELIATTKRSRYMDEMSDDFAYSNGKVDRWNSLIKHLENLKKKLGD